jgi:hypothetical protein
LTVIRIDTCEEDVIIPCGLYLLSEEEKRKNTKTGPHPEFSLRGGGITLSLYIIYV